jgi:hypothetical protein
MIQTIEKNERKSFKTFFPRIFFKKMCQLHKVTNLTKHLKSFFISIFIVVIILNFTKLLEKIILIFEIIGTILKIYFLKIIKK